MINAFCYYYGVDSWSRHAREFFGAWQKQQDVIITSWNKADATTDPVPLLPQREPHANYPGIGLGPIEPMVHVAGSQRIAFIVWETTLIPSARVKVLQSMDAVWTPSTWGRQLLINNGLDPETVGVVPEGVDTERFKPAAEPPEQSRPFRFLYVGKWEQRKATDVLVKAFCDEFKSNEPVELVLHGWNPYLPGFDLHGTIRRYAGTCAPAIVPSYPLKDEDMVRLYNSCDAFVLPTRAEAWGLPITEAMACGLPVIVTQYSAPLDYLDRDCAYLIEVEKMVAVNDSFFFPVHLGLGEWAQPDINSLRRLMRHVFENPEEARAKGIRARERVCNHWTWDHAVATARRLLSQY
ncbi:MAG TPA: glycosyltransferase family 4 protein [Pyrinomonadaceae bacterium]|nr:glycosyltransferase family 4 protein [Pyrinomonadaceae bacterium]